MTAFHTIRRWLPLPFTSPTKGEKEPVIFAVRSEAKLSPETSGEGLFFSRSECQSRKRRSARCLDLRRPLGHTHGSDPVPLSPDHRPPPTPQGLPGVLGPHDDHPLRVQPPSSGTSMSSPSSRWTKLPSSQSKSRRRHPEWDASAVCRKRHCLV